MHRLSLIKVKNVFEMKLELANQMRVTTSFTLVNVSDMKLELAVQTRLTTAFTQLVGKPFEQLLFSLSTTKCLILVTNTVHWKTIHTRIKPNAQKDIH